VTNPVSWMQTANSLGIHVKYSFIGAGLTPTLLQQGGSLFDGALAELDIAPPNSDVAGAKEYRADIAKYAPGTVIDTSGMYGWMAIKAFGDVAKTINGAVTRASVLAAMSGFAELHRPRRPHSAVLDEQHIHWSRGKAPRMFNPTLYPVRLQGGVEMPLGAGFLNPFHRKNRAKLLNPTARTPRRKGNKIRGARRLSSLLAKSG